MNRTVRLLILSVLVFGAVFAPHYSKARAGLARLALPGSWVADVVFCQDGFTVTAYGTLATDITTTVSVLSATPASETGSVFTFTGPGDAEGTAFFAWDTWQPPGKLATITLDRSEDGASLTGGLGRFGFEYVGDCLLMPYVGPALPSPGERNLVLITSDTPVLNAPGGVATGDTLRACQTAFVIDTSGNYGEIFVMGGWINLAYTLDVNEDYGQPGGTPVAPGCLGR
jgi:hypothetical protein